jgi:hypothetical protein
MKSKGLFTLALALGLALQAQAKPELTMNEIE